MCSDVSDSSETCLIPFNELAGFNNTNFITVYLSCIIMIITPKNRDQRQTINNPIRPTGKHGNIQNTPTRTITDEKPDIMRKN